MARSLGLVIVLVVLATACGDDSTGGSETAAVAPDGDVVEVQVDGRDHVLGEVDYPTSPPAGGDHFGAWQNCGFYDRPLIDEVAVHSLEHGVVWVTYLPETDAETLEQVKIRTVSESHMLASPYADQDSPLYLTAWGRQLAVTEWDDPAVEEFIGDHIGRRSPTAPEPGASCTDAVGLPPSDPTRSYEEIGEIMAEGEG